MSNHTMIPVIISGLSPTSYQKMLEKKALKNIPLRTSEMVKNRQTKISKRRQVQKETEEIAQGSAVNKLKKISAGQFLEGTLARMQGNDDKRRQNLAKLKLEVFEENAKDCSFTPRVLRKSASAVRTDRSHTPLEIGRASCRERV